jgi:hypothetical protein
MASAKMVICRKLEKAGRNANASTEDPLLNKKSHGICQNGHLQKMGKAGQNADASTEDALLNKKSHDLPKWSSAENWERQGEMPMLPQRTHC